MGSECEGRIDGRTSWESYSQEEVVKAIREMKVEKAAGPSEVSVEMIAVNGEIGISVMVVMTMIVMMLYNLIPWVYPLFF